MHLQANPSYGEGAALRPHYEPHSDYPLSVAVPHLHPPTLAYYHDEVFKHPCAAGVSLPQISQKLLKVELCPWASKKWSGRGRLEQALSEFPSRALISKFVEGLVDDGAIFIMARAWTRWFKAVPSLLPLIGTRVFKSRAPVSPYMSSGSYPDGWAKIVALMRS